MIVKQQRLPNGDFTAIDIGLRLQAYSEKKSNGCVEWVRYKNNLGYGLVHYKGKARMAHRVAYYLENGDIDDNLVIDHLCRNRACINPDHLELVTQKENILRGDQPRVMSDKYKNQEKCVHGHILLNNRYEYNRIDKTNGKTYIQRRCKTCIKNKSLRGSHVRAKREN